jgi:hypothetical protein
MELDLTEEEFGIIRMAMAIHAASKQPKLTWAGWHHIAVALAIGSDQARKESGGRIDTPDYRSVMSAFLKSTGFQFLNKDDRAAAVRVLPQWGEIDAWRSSLPQQRRQALNNPRETYAAFLEHRRELGDPEAKRQPASRGSRSFPSLLEQYTAVLEQLESAEQRAAQAERDSAYFAEMAKALAKKAQFTDDQVAEIRRKLRSEHDGEGEGEGEV